MAKPCARCGVNPKAAGSNKYCTECREIVNSPASVRARWVTNAAAARRKNGVARRKSLDAPPGTRWCPVCERYLKHESFGSFVKSGKPHAYCKACKSGIIFSRQVKNRFGITADEYDSILESQGGGCAICGTQPKKLRLAVDHDHKTGNVRGLLCKLCNKNVLGGAKDRADILRKAADYLDSPPAFGVVGQRVAPNPTGRRR